MKAVVPPAPGERGSLPTIRPDRCTECVGHFAWPRCAALCPVSAVRRDPDHRDRRTELLARWFSLTGKDVYEWIEPPALDPILETGEAGG